jgi:hypothetical protein
MPVTENLATSYHQQDTDYYCGAACAQMVLYSVGTGLLDQDQLYNDNHSHSVIEGGWATAPDGLQWTMNHYAPPAPAGPPHYGAYNFVNFALDSEDAASRKIVWTIHNYQVSPIAMVYHAQHWIVVRGYTASAAPSSWNDVGYTIDSFDVNNPWPPTPSWYDASVAPPPPHTNGTDGCGTGGDRGIVNENISYAMWQSTYMTGIDFGHWNGKFVTIADPSPAPNERGRASRPLLEPLPYKGRLIHGEVVLRRAEESLKAYGLTERSEYRHALGRATFQKPLLVQRLDMPDTFYHIAPATEGEHTPLAVAVDAKTGIYLQSAVHTNAKGSVFMHLPTKELEELLMGHTIELPNLRGRIPIREEALCQYPSLVWKPCRESLSPFYPFYMFTIGSERIYVRTDGAIFTELHDTERGI